MSKKVTVTREQYRQIHADIDALTKRFFVADEGGFYNAFSFDMFADGGYLEGYKGEDGYHIDDYDIVKCFRRWEDASDYADKMNEMCS